MEKHPLIGEGIVKPLRSFRNILNPIKHHHELLNGEGYPDSLKSEDIPLITRILTVSDIFDALTSDRPYRSALGRQEAIQELDKMVEGGKLDKNVVDTVKKIIR